jgi:hypothetical protein
MTKFAIYYGITRGSLDKKVISFGNRSEIQAFKDQCKLDLLEPAICAKYQSLVLATDYGLTNQYKTTAPVKKVTKKK